MSSKKTPWPWTRRLSSLRGTFCPMKPRCGASTGASVRSGATVVDASGCSRVDPFLRRRDVALAAASIASKMFQ